MRMVVSSLFLFCLGAFSVCFAERPTHVAPRPPMGWNSWDAYGLTVSELEFRDNVDVLADTLKPFGWEYAIVDEGWYLPEPSALHGEGKLRLEMDAFGRFVPATNRFPSAMQSGTNEGFVVLARYVHSRGLKFGIHIVRGIPRVAVERHAPIAGSAFSAAAAADVTDACPWDPTSWGVRDNAAGQAWYDSLLRQYASWGVDYLKVDCVSDHPYRGAEIRMIHRAMLKAGRPMVLSLSPGPTSAGHTAEVQRYAQLWRISDDIWDRWKGYGIYEQFPLAAGWALSSGPDSWPDADMLPLGLLGPRPGEGQPRPTRLTSSEQRTLLTLWCIARSPLILGANLTRLDSPLKAMLTNRDVLEVDQSGHDQMQASREHDSVAWTSKGPGGVRYLALFNLGDKETTVDRPLTFYGLPAGAASLKNLWEQTESEATDSLRVVIAPHDAVLYRVTVASSRAKD